MLSTLTSNRDGHDRHGFVFFAVFIFAYEGEVVGPGVGNFWREERYTRCIAVNDCGSREIFLDGVLYVDKCWFLEPFRGEGCAVQPVAAPVLSGVVEG